MTIKGECIFLNMKICQGTYCNCSALRIADRYIS